MVDDIMKMVKNADSIRPKCASTGEREREEKRRKNQTHHTKCAR